MDVLLDQETAPALRARKKSRPTIHVRHVEYLPEQVSLIRFLEGQEPLTGGSTTAQHLNLDLLLSSVVRHGRGTHGGSPIPARETEQPFCDAAQHGLPKRAFGIRGSLTTIAA
jgi:hypothetical protein